MNISDIVNAIEWKLESIGLHVIDSSNDTVKVVDQRTDEVYTISVSEDSNNA